MHPALQLSLSILLGAAAGGTAAVLAAPEAAAPRPVEAAAADAGLADRVEALEDALERQSAELEELALGLRAELGALGRRPVASATEVAPAAPEEETAAAPAPEAPAAEEPVDAAALFEQILAADDATASELWRRAGELGLTDELVALFEARVEADPNDPELRVELGSAYIQKIQEVGNGPLAGVWATKADQAFDAALELDPDHWGARMNKAVSLSFWPPIFGKQKEAVSQFEQLIDRQATLPPSPSHAQPYLLLGNLHWQRGDTEAAYAVWKDGAAKFPDSQALADKLD